MSTNHTHTHTCIEIHTQQNGNNGNTFQICSLLVGCKLGGGSSNGRNSISSKDVTDNMKQT